MNETVYLEDLGAEVNWVNWDEKLVNVHRWVLADCGCCSDSVNDDYMLTELSDEDYETLLREYK